MILEYFRATGANEAVQGLSTLFAISLQDDDFQDFDVRWDHARLTVSEMPPDAILEGLNKSKLQSSVQLQTVMALYDQVTARTKEPNCHKLKTAVKLLYDQMMRTRNFRVRNEVVERGAVTKSQKGKKAYVERKVEECFQWKAHGQCSKGDSCKFSHDTQAPGNSGEGQRRKGRSSSLASLRRRNILTARDKNPHRDQAVNRKTHMVRVEFHADSNSGKNPSCKFWHPPVCLDYRSEKKDVYMATNAISDKLRQKESPAKSRRKVVRKDQLLY